MSEAAGQPDPIAEITPTAEGLIVVPMTGSWDYYTSYWATRQGPNYGVRPFLHRRPGFVEDMRQHVCDLFLESGLEWLMMVDNDTVPSFSVERAIARAKGIDAKVVCYPTPFVGSDPRVLSNLFMTAVAEDGVAVLGTLPWHDLPWDDLDVYGNRKMFQITSAGMGCTLIHRDILSRLCAMAKSGELTDWPFRAVYSEGKLKYGEDQMFFLRVQGALDVPVYADLECWCSHRKVVMMNPNLARDYFEGTRGAPDPGINPAAPYVADTRPTTRATIMPDTTEVLKKVILTDTGV